MGQPGETAVVMEGRAGQRVGVPKIAEAARAARRGQNLAAARACFARSGYHATTMADVASQAGVSEGTPYLYFNGRQAMFVAPSNWTAAPSERIDAAAGTDQALSARLFTAPSAAPLSDGAAFPREPDMTPGAVR